MMKVLVTGVAGFIGAATAGRLLARGDCVVGIDNLNDYYEISLKQARLQPLMTQQGFQFAQLDVADRAAMEALFAEQQFDTVIHLAAQAGVRYSIENPHAYIDSNLLGFTNILEGARQTAVKHLVYASSSSVYGANKSMPYAVQDNVDHPLSLYAASKKANELMAHTYAHLYNIPCTGLRFFTVYGPWGRPDMAFFKFTKKILAGEPIDVYNYGNHSRDFTYIDDIVEGVIRVHDKPAQINPDWRAEQPESGSSFAPWRVYNIGNQNPVNLLESIEILEQALGKTAKKNLLPMQPGDVPDTWADVSQLVADVDYKPSTSLHDGLRHFADWYRRYYG